jgi:hypothetical protein
MDVIEADETVKVALVYNPFDLSKVVREELVYDSGKSLDHYIEGLPEECSWRIGLNGVPIEEADYTEVVPAANDVISVVCVPRGGGAKDILRLVALIAVVVVAAIALGPVGLGLTGATFAAAFAATVAIGSFLVNMALGPTVPKMKVGEDDGQSYGYDGAKNTAREGITLPVVYGQFQVAGNYVDVFTKNVGDDQYLYGRCVLSDGEIDSVVGNPEINELPITDYKAVEWGYTIGTLTDAINTRFPSSKAHFLRQDKLSTTYTEYTTTDDVDAIELNFLFPNGLCEIDTDDGDKEYKSVTVEIQYAPYGTATWTNVGVQGSITDGYTVFSGSSPTATQFSISTQAQAGAGVLNGEATYSLEYSPAGANTWTNIKTFNEVTTTYVSEATFSGGDRYYESYSIEPPTYTYSTSYPVRVTDVTLPSGTYDFRVTGSGVVLATGYLGPAVAPGSGGSSAVTSVTYRDKRVKAIRKTYRTPTLVRGRYHIRCRRTSADSTAQNIMDDIHLTDVGEIQDTKVALRSVATGWFVAKMTDQLSGIPNVTWKVKGVKVPIYDNNGTVTATQWSDNPADIVLDMLISERRGSLRDKITIDYPAYVKWRSYCASEGLKFNGVFDEMTSLWDALQQVYRVGRAMPVRIGTKLSVAIDKPTQPAMLFGPGNIYKDSFSISYLPLADRANEFEVSYYDKDDRNKKKTIRIADPVAAQSGEIPKTAQYDLFGVDNFTQAQKEVWYQLYNNRLARRVVTFDAPVEAIGLTLGDVALIQHDMVEWGTSGRLAAVTSTTNLTLDKDVTIEAATTYSLLVVHDTLQRATCDVSLITGKTFNVTNLSNTSWTADQLKRIKLANGDEAAIVDYVFISGTNAQITIDGNISAVPQAATLWDVDVIEERTVTNSPGTTKVITVSSAFSALPNVYSNYMFGVNTTVKRPYRLRSISGDGIERRTLTFGEYNELVYSAPETVIPAPAVSPPKTPSHVTGLSLVPEPIRTGTGTMATLSWQAGEILNYGGADIYMSINGAEYSFLNTVLNTTSFMLPLQEGAKVSLKVVAFNDKGYRALVNSAPSVDHEVITAAATLVSPTSLTWTLDKVNFTANGQLSWTLGDSALGPVSPIHRVQVYLDGTTEWIDKGICSETKFDLFDLPAGAHEARIRAENSTGAISNWVTIFFTISNPTMTAPSITSDGTAVDHTLNPDGSANVSFEWVWSGTESTIDGFEIIAYNSTSNAAYIIGTTPSAEDVTLLAPNKRAIIFKGIPATDYYTFYVRAFKRVHTSFSSTGVLYSTAIKPSLASENPYRPTNQVAFTGDIVGTLAVGDINVWAEITGTGRPADFATVGATWGTDLNNIPDNLAELVGTEAIQNTEILNVISNDDVLSAGEKFGQLQEVHNSLENRYAQAFSRATTLALSTSALTTARTNWSNLLNSYVTGTIELLGNVDFDSATGWTTGTGWSISSGRAFGAAATGDLTQSFSGMVQGKSYEITYSITSYTSGSVRVDLIGGGTTNGTTRSAAGVYTEILAAPATPTAMRFAVPSAFTGEIDFVSVREVVLWNDFDKDTLIYRHFFDDQNFPTNWTSTTTNSTVGVYTQLTDTGTNWQIVSRAKSQAGANQYSFGLVCKKDSTAKTTRFPLMRVIGVGGTTKQVDIPFDTSTGEVINADGNASAFGILDLGDDWLVWGTFTTNANNTTIQMEVYPAVGASSFLTGYDSTTSGSIQIRSPMIVRGDVNDLGRFMLMGRQKVYSKEIETLARLISERDAQLANWPDVTGTGRPSDGAGTSLIAFTSAGGEASKTTIIGNRVEVTTALTTNWRSFAWPSNAFPGTAIVQGRSLTNTGNQIIGLALATHLNNADTAPYEERIAYAIQLNGTTATWREGATTGVLQSNIVNTDTCSVLYDGRQIHYCINGNAVVTHQVAEGQLLYAKTIQHSLGSGWRDIQFEPYTITNWAALGGTGLPESNATVDANIVGDNPVNIFASVTGTPKSGQFPKSLGYILRRNGVDLTSGVTWAATLISGNVTFTTSGTGTLVLSLTGPNDSTLALESVIRLTATYQSIQRAYDIKVIRIDDPPTTSGGSGATTVTTTQLGTTNNSQTYDLTNAVSATLTARAGPNGQVACTAPITFQRSPGGTVGRNGAYGKWQWRTVGGSFADIATEVASTQDAKTFDLGDGSYSEFHGNISVSQTKTGLTNGVDYEFRFVWRNTYVSGDGDAVSRVSGTMQAAGS